MRPRGRPPTGCPGIHIDTLVVEVGDAEAAAIAAGRPASLGPAVLAALRARGTLPPKDTAETVVTFCGTGDGLPQAPGTGPALRSAAWGRREEGS